MTEGNVTGPSVTLIDPSSILLLFFFVIHPFHLSTLYTLLYNPPHYPFLHSTLSTAYIYISPAQNSSHAFSFS